MSCLPTTNSNHKKLSHASAWEGWAGIQTPVKSRARYGAEDPAVRRRKRVLQRRFGIQSERSGGGESSSHRGGVDAGEDT